MSHHHTYYVTSSYTLCHIIWFACYLDVSLTWFAGEHFAAKTPHSAPACTTNSLYIHILKSQHTVTFYSKYSRALTFENVCLVLSGSMSLCTCRHRVRAQSSCQLAQTSRCAQGRLHVPARVLPHVCSRRRHARQETHTVSGSAAATNLTELRVWGKKGTNCSRG